MTPPAPSIRCSIGIAAVSRLVVTVVDSPIVRCRSRRAAYDIAGLVMERVGSDRVTVKANRLVVESRADMPGWEVRSFRRVAIVYRGERWFVVAKAHDGWRFRYTLEPWDAARD